MAILEEISVGQIASSFDDRGFSLFMEERTNYTIGIEETIVASLIKDEPRLQEGIPILLSKNEINYNKLRYLIDEYNCWNEFGYFGDFLSRHFKNDNLKQLVQYCKQKLKPEANLVSFNHELFKKYQKPNEKKWNLFGAPSYNALERHFEKTNIG